MFMCVSVCANKNLLFIQQNNNNNNKNENLKLKRERVQENEWEKN